MSRWGELGQRAKTWLLDGVEAMAQAVRPVWRWLRETTKALTGAGWAMLVVAGLAWGAGAAFGWVEAGVVAAFALAALVFAVASTFGRTDVRVELGLAPVRVFAGASALGSFELTNISNRPIAMVKLRMPVGQSAADFTTPALEAGQSYTDWVTIPTARRGVVQVGPVTTYRSDPWNLIRREVQRTAMAELFIHPAIAAVDELGSGLLRDLEGNPTLDASDADLAFHALRDYAPGDDRRHIHWRSSARLSQAQGQDRFLVRRYYDTRRSHVVIVSDLRENQYQIEDDVELGLSCAASVAVRTVMDAMDLTVVCGHEVVSGMRSNHVLDAYARAQLVDVDPAQSLQRVRTEIVDASLVFVVTGDQTTSAQLRQWRGLVHPWVPLVVLCVGLGSPISLTAADGLTQLTIGSLRDLPQALKGSLT
ncbi:MAG: DUF58 domain-containing protein [Propionibacteriaceae bacterium]|jgi:uncharacterized protein (DUF58 family)|nr:DUF58 domain-containing protein [Propionibacteriaceae bacterium]